MVCAAGSDGLASVEVAAVSVGLAATVTVPDLLSSTSPSSTSAVDKCLGVDSPSELSPISSNPSGKTLSAHLA